MLKVLLALAPAVILWVVFFRWAAVFQLLICLSVCYVCEGLALSMRKKNVHLYLLDGSTAVLAVLLMFCIPPIAPWWVAGTASLFAVLLGKHVYGGLGENLFNPAMLGYAITLLSFPAEYAVWPVMSFDVLYLGNIDQVVEIIFGASVLDWGMSAATPLTVVTQLSDTSSIDFLGLFVQPWFLMSFLYFIGGLLLLYWKLIRWHIPLGFLSGVIFATVIAVWLNAEILEDTLYLNLFSGATMIGAFFIATDPVSAPSYRIGKLIYAFIIGALLVLIRTWGNFPDGLAFAVLFGNLLVPFIDRYFVPRPKNKAVLTQSKHQ